MDYSNLFSSGLRVMAHYERDTTAPSSPSPASMVNIHPIALERRSTERGHGRITSLPARLFKRTMSTRSTLHSPRAGSSGWSSWSMPTSRRQSVDQDRAAGSREALIDVSLGKGVILDDNVWETKAKQYTDIASLHTPPPTPYSGSFAFEPPRRPLPPLPSPSPSPVPSKRNSNSPQPRSGTSFLFFSSSPSSSTNLLSPPGTRSRPSSVHTTTLSITSRRSSRHYRDDVSLMTADEVDDWRRFYVTLVPGPDDS